MGNNTLNAEMVSKMFLAGAKNLDAKKDWINELNVFPVPDGDTGTNMTMTIMSAAKDVSSLGSNADMQTLCKSISTGSLRGARGNSGVILSQLLRGFTKGIRDYEELDTKILASAFEKAVETAYKAVMKPKEGTILTVAKGASQKATELANEGVTDLDKFFDETIKYADEVLSKTPDMLPVLKEAGVVDSGGQGLVQVLKGAYDGFLGKEIDLTINESSATPVAAKMQPKHAQEADIKFGYCTEFIVLLTKPLNVKQEMDFKSFLESIGDSIVMVADDEICKVHVHSNDPGLAIQRALKYGQLSNMKIDNMRMEHREKLFHETGDGRWLEIKAEVNGAAEQTPTYRQGDVVPLMDGSSAKVGEEAEEQAPHKDSGFVTVCAGDGLAEIFRSLGVDYVIEGGQTMNPSTEDILNAINKVNADTVYVLPNNKNIILAANQAKDLCEDKNVVVIPTKNVPQGVTAVINFIPDMDAESVTEAMTEAIGMVKSGEVTYAVRDTVIDGVEIKSGDYMGIADSGIAAVGAEIENVTFEMIKKIMSDELELISIYYGSDIDEDTAKKLQQKVKAEFGNCDVELQYGGQPIYYYIVSAE
ncbi:MAG: DAK2 domain-containing protein [Butyrivibrio sp.]|nr:DAK2 domain-containing protein [Butyrivibrio sp.]